jgi:membrane protease YdiL (CAAX protease family)
MLLESVLASGLLEDPRALFEGRTPGTALILLFCFAAWPLALALALTVVHRRGFASLLGTDLMRQFFWVFGTLVLLHTVIAMLPPWGMPGAEVNLAPGLWLALLPISLIAVFVQVASEEVLFRGYLQQTLAARGLPPLVWIGVPALIFGLAHYDADAGRNAMLIALWAVLFGVLMADLTARAGSLGPAIAVHMMNNALALLVLGMDGTLSGLALYTLPVGMGDEAEVRALLPLDFMYMFVSYLAARLALRR